MTAAAFIDQIRAIRSLSPWILLLAVAILLLGGGLDITSRHAVDPAIFGHAMLTLFGLGLFATLVVRGRRRSMGHICYGLAALESVCVVLWAWDYVPTIYGLVLASVTIGELYAAGLLFHRLPPLSADNGTAESAEWPGAWNVACVLSIVAALLAWGAVVAAFAVTGETRWPLATWGVVFAALPFVSRSALAPTGALGSSVTAGLLALLFAFTSSPAKADPPYGDDFDAPDTVEAAVLIGPGAYRALYEAVRADVDYYRFAVSEGQDISISCAQQLVHPDVSGARLPCTIRLIDPNGIDQSSGISSDGSSTHLSVTGAAAGEWRLEVSGYDVYFWPSFCCRTATYLFSVELTPANNLANSGDAAGGGGSNGGAFGHVLSLFLAAAALLRKQRRFGRVAGAGVLSVLSFAAAAQTDLSDKPIQPGAPAQTAHTPLGPFGPCTLNFVFTDATNTYIGTTGRCTYEVGEDVHFPGTDGGTVPGRRFGTVVFRVFSGTDEAPDKYLGPASSAPVEDFALILIDADQIGNVSPVIRGVGAPPTGYTTSDTTADGDELILYSQGAGFSAAEETRRQTGPLVFDDAIGFRATFVGTPGGSGAPLVHAASGKALGVASALGGPGIVGSTIEHVLVLLSDAGFDVTLATEPSVADKAATQTGGGGLNVALLLPLALLALRRRKERP